MFSKNKKSELTRVEASTLAMIQWCILNPFSGEKSNRNVFFTQATVTTTSLKKLERLATGLNNRGLTNDVYDFAVEKTKEHKAIQVEAFFTTLEEDASFGSEGTIPPRPKIEAQFVFLNQGSGCYVWEVESCHILAKNYDTDQYDPYFVFHRSFLTDAEKHDGKYRHVSERELQFIEFCKKLSHHSPWGATVL